MTGTGFLKLFGDPGTRTNRSTLWFYERECQEKIVLPRAEGARELVSAFSPCHALCQWVMTKYLGICSDARPDHTHFSPLAARLADQREAVGGCWFRLSGFPS
jgi:hypothetical protein